MADTIDTEKIGYIRFCGLPVAGTLTGPIGTSEWVKKNGKWVRV